MPKTTTMSKRDIAQRAASRKAPSVKAVAKATTKVLDKPRKPVTLAKLTNNPVHAPLADALAAMGVPAEVAVGLAKAGKAGKVAPAAKAAAKPAKAAKPAAKAGNGAVGGVKGRIIAMIDAKGGTSAAEVCKALGWVKAGATIGRAIKLAGFKVAKVRDADGVLRYSREG